MGTGHGAWGTLVGNGAWGKEWGHSCIANDKYRQVGRMGYGANGPSVRGDAQGQGRGRQAEGAEDWGKGMAMGHMLVAGAAGCLGCIQGCGGERGDRIKAGRREGGGRLTHGRDWVLTVYHLPFKLSLSCAPLQKLKSLKAHCLELDFNKPTADQMLKRIGMVAAKEVTIYGTKIQLRGRTSLSLRSMGGIMFSLRIPPSCFLKGAVSIVSSEGCCVCCYR